TTADFITGFNNTEGIWNDLVKFTATDSVNFKSVAGKEKELVQQRLKALLARYKWRNAGFYQVLNSNDAMVKKAMETIAK
ncbi:MAG: carboxyl-terminal protease, partial [Chitinophagaceae bacterium]